MLDQLVFISPDEGRDRGPSQALAWIGRVLVSAVLVVVAVGAWWLFVPVSVDRPEAAIWCPTPRGPAPEPGHFDAREVLGHSLRDGDALARQHGCTVDNQELSGPDLGRTNRINVETTRGVISRIHGVS